MDLAENTLRWFRIYTGAMAFFSLLYGIGGVAMFVYAPQLADPENPESFWMVMGVTLGVFGLIFIAAHLLPFFVGRLKWVWVYDLVLICIGFTSCCTIPFSVLLLIYWIKPEIQAAFGMGSPAPRPPWRPD